MTQQSSIHAPTEWAKSRLDEMNAAVRAFEAQMGQLASEARTRAESALTDLRARREKFKSWTEQAYKVNETAWSDLRARMEADWNAFDQAMDKGVNAAMGQAQQGRAAFQAQAEAQMKAWDQSLDRFNQAAVKFHGEQTAGVKTALDQMKNEAQRARSNLDKAGQATATSWSAFRSALNESRAAFDKATQSAQEAFKRALD